MESLDIPEAACPSVNQGYNCSSAARAVTAGVQSLLRWLLDDKPGILSASLQNNCCSKTFVLLFVTDASPQYAIQPPRQK